MDEHVRRAITEGLRLRDVDILTAQEDGHRNIDDAILLDRAGALGRVLFSQDEDLLAEAKMRLENGIPFGGVIYGHQLYLTIGTCVRELKFLSQVADPEDLANRVEYIPL